MVQVIISLFFLFISNLAFTASKSVVPSTQRKYKRPRIQDYASSKRPCCPSFLTARPEWPVFTVAEEEWKATDVEQMRSVYVATIQRPVAWTERSGASWAELKLEFGFDVFPATHVATIISVIVQRRRSWRVRVESGGRRAWKWRKLCEDSDAKVIN